MTAKPFEKRHDIRVAPHPAREAGEVSKRTGRVAIVAGEPDPPVRAIRVRPVRLDGDDVEAFSNDERFGELRPRAIELVRSVRRLADEDDARVADYVDERTKSVRRRLEPDGAAPQGLDEVGVATAREPVVHLHPQAALAI